MKKIVIVTAVMIFVINIAAFGQIPDNAAVPNGGNAIKAPSGVTAIPSKISYQGVLTTSGGAPVPDGSYDLKFELFNVVSGGSYLWTETQLTVSVQHGTFNVLLGSVTPLTGLFYQPLWIEISAIAGPGISSTIVFSPRNELASVPFALGPWQQSGQHLYYDQGRVAVGMENPLYLFHIKGGNPTLAIEESGVSNANLMFRRENAGKWLLMNNWGTPADNLAIFDYSVGGKVFQVNQGGNIGIGTANPQAKLDIAGKVLAKDTLEVGSSLFNGLLNVYQSGSASPVVSAQKYPGNIGGEVLLRDELGNPIVHLRPNGNGEGGGIRVYRTPTEIGFEGWGDWYGLGEGFAAVYGKNRSILFEPRFAGNLSVQLPDSSVSSEEMLDEPGISNSQRVSFVSASSAGTTIVADSVEINVPADGYIEVTGGAWLNIVHTTGTTTEVWLGINELRASLSTYPGLGVIRIPSAIPTSATSWGYPCMTSRFYSVTAGTHTYYLNLRFAMGAGSYAETGYPYVRAKYYPTLYGTSTVISPTASFNPNAATDGSENYNIEQVTITPEEHLMRLKAKAAQLKSELESAIKQLDNQVGNGSGDGPKNDNN